MGPVIGATVASQVLPVTALLINESRRNDATYIALMCRRPTFQTMAAPRIQMATIGQMTLPHWMLSSDALAGARNRSALTPKFDGFQRCRFLRRRTYFDAIDTSAHSTYVQRNGD